MQKTSARTAPATVDEYLAMQIPQVRSTLEKVRKAIKAAAPKAEEVISYQIPTFKLNGPIAAIAAFPNHCSFYTTSHSVIKAFKDDLKSYDTSGVTIRFPHDEPLPDKLIKKLVVAKVIENEARVKSKK